MIFSALFVPARSPYVKYDRSSTPQHPDGPDSLQTAKGANSQRERAGHQLLLVFLLVLSVLFRREGRMLEA